MATEKSLNIRQIKATETLAAELAELRQAMARIEAGLAELKAMLAEMARPSKLEQASQAVNKAAAKK